MVSRLKCPECGLVNFASATECKRCRLNLSVSEQQSDRPSAPAVAVSIVPTQLAPEFTAEDSALRVSGAAERQPKPFAPLPEYFADEPAPYTLDMILFGVTLGLSILLLIYQLQEYYSLYDGAEWKAFTNLRSGVYVPMLEPLFYLEWIVKALAIFAAVFLVFPFLRKSYAFLRWVRVYLIGNFIFILVDGWAVREMETSLKGKQLGKAFEPFLDHLRWYIYLYGIAILLTFVWFRYFTTSNRVKQTFIN